MMVNDAIIINLPRITLQVAMARNIEIKAHIDSISTVLANAMALASSAPVEIHQDDTFFHCAHGRLKLRTFDAHRGELIFYRRADQAGPKESFYLITPTAEPQTLREVLTAANGVIGRVVKQRTLLLAGRTRIHLDRVESLGTFLELEVVLQENESSEDGVAEALRLMARLGVSSGQLIEGAYLDMLKRG